MSLAVVALVATAWVSAQEPAPSSVTVSMVALQATKEGRQEKFYDREALRLKDALKSFPFDTFKVVKSSNQQAAFGKETKFPINAQYDLYVTPQSRDDQGRVRMKTRITMKPPPDGKRREAINALETTLIIAPGKHVNVGGLRLDQGELIIVLTVGG